MDLLVEPFRHNTMMNRRLLFFDGGRMAPV